MPKEIESFNHLISKGLLETGDFKEEEKVTFFASPSLIFRALSTDRKARKIGFRLWINIFPTAEQWPRSIRSRLEKHNLCGWEIERLKVKRAQTTCF